MGSMDELRSPSLPTSPAASIIVLPSHSMLPVLQLLGTIRCPEKPRAAQSFLAACPPPRPGLYPCGVLRVGLVAFGLRMLASCRPPPRLFWRRVAVLPRVSG